MASRELRLATMALVVGAAAYSLLLCGALTAGLPISNVIVMAVDGGIVAAALGLSWLRPQPVALFALLAIALNFLAIALLFQAIDMKSVRDALVIVAFLGLGLSVGDLRLAMAAFALVAISVVGFALFEYLAPSVYVQHFDVLGFYQMRGSVDAQQARYIDNSLFVSSMRNNGRFLLPFLGPHRVSSIFLEPVSLGNFGAIAAAWGLSLWHSNRRASFLVIGVGLFAIVMADARFAAFALPLFLIAYFVPPRMVSFVLAPAPLICIAIILIMGAVGNANGDDLPSRLAVSGQALASLDVPALLGASPGGRGSVDSGYTYAVTSFGAPFCALLWLGFVALPTPGVRSARFKLMIGLYICALLCVSGSSLFALKTAGVCWFLMGATIASEQARAAALHYAALRTAGRLGKERPA